MLNAPLVVGGRVVELLPAAGGRVCYRAAQEVPGKVELYSVPDDGSAAPVKLNEPQVNSTDVLQVALTPDGTVALFTQGGGSGNLVAAAFDGSQAPRLLASAPVTQFWPLPSGVRVAYARREPVGFLTRERLSVTGVAGPAPIDLAVTPPETNPLTFSSGSAIGGVLFTSTHAVFSDYQLGKDGPAEFHLSAVPLDGSTPPVRLAHGPAVPGRDFAVVGDRVVLVEDGVHAVNPDGTGRIRLTPDGWDDAFGLGSLLVRDAPPAVVFLGRQDGTGLLDLFLAPLDGPAVSLLGPANVQVRDMVAAPAGVVAILRTIGGSNFGALTAVDLAPVGPPRVLNDPGQDPTGALGGSTFLSTEGGVEVGTNGQVLFRSRSGAGSGIALWSAPFDGSAPARLVSPAMGPENDVQSLRVAPGGEHVLYLADQNHHSTLELFAALLPPGAEPVSLLPLEGGPVVGDVTGFRASPAGDRAVYRADQRVDELPELHVVAVDGRTPPFALDASERAPLDVAFEPSGQHVLFLDASGDLRSVEPVPGDAAVRVDAGTIVGPLHFVPEDSLVVYRRPLPGIPTGQEIVATRSDGSGAPVILSSIATRTVPDLAIAPGGTVVFLSDREASTVYQLYAVPVDGSAAPVRVHPALTGGRDVTDFRLSPDGRTIVYRADARVDNEFELWRVPVKGARPPVRLSVPRSNADVGDDFTLDPHGRWLLYRQRRNNRSDLYASAWRSAPVRPSGAPDVVALTSGVADLDVEPGARVTRSGWVVFLARERTGVPLRLFQVPADGRSDPVLLSDSLGTGGGVVDFALTPDESRVVFRARKTTTSPLTPYAVELGRSGPVPLDVLPDWADLGELHLSPDLHWVVYTCDRKADGAVELFAAPVDGSSPAIVLNDPLPPGGDVQPGFAVLPGGFVVYRADQEADEVFELFRAALPGPPRAHAPWPTRASAAARSTKRIGFDR